MKPVIGKQLVTAEQTHGIGRIAVLILATVIFAAAWSSDDRDRIEPALARAAEPRRAASASRRESGPGPLSCGLAGKIAASPDVRSSPGKLLSLAVVQTRDIHTIFTGTPALLGGTCTLQPDVASHNAELDDCPL
ncbi:MAG: hypothetical protein DWQ34_28060 [Planctomycetota bacterium]|nr:MAG: hypothetical protein DWQ29_16405 [Planctomycetota bacterium]REJ85956.1 MAG: hypothetical protein DWQ34_28060 [Planctomycetota bacterium]REK28498.1 MAG: hypothetical protein DWQ41_05995 [Planctomycetota bacterium]REK29082.1 MAG: hypothetical protein DWQ45_23335 [Planctomycetota bacterium]